MVGGTAKRRKPWGRVSSHLLPPYLVQLLLDFALLLRHHLQLLGVGLGELAAGFLGSALLGAEGFARLAVSPDLLLQHLQLHLQQLLRVEEPLLVLPLVCLVCGRGLGSAGRGLEAAGTPPSAATVLTDDALGKGGRVRASLGGVGAASLLVERRALGTPTTAPPRCPPRPFPTSPESCRATSQHSSSGLAGT